MGQNYASVLSRVVVSIKKVQPIGFGGYAVRYITHSGKAVKLIYLFPLDRGQIIRDVLSRIERDDGNSHS